jgi:hypothetical protein
VTSRHHLWQARWAIDSAQRTLTHEPTGLVVYPGQPQPLPNGDSVLLLLHATHGPHNAPRMLTRLAWEAYTLWAEHTATPHLPGELDDQAEAAVTNLMRPV